MLRRAWPLSPRLEWLCHARMAFILIPFTPSISDLRKAKIDQPAVLMSSDGKRLATFKPMNRQWVPLNQVSPHVINALIATEDHRFYRAPRHRLAAHRDGPCCASSSRTGRAAPRSRSSWRATCSRRRSAAQRTVTRKIKETITAIKIEYAYTQERDPRDLSQHACRSSTTPSASRWPRAPTSTSPPESSTCSKARPDRHAEGHQLLQPGAQSRARAPAPQRGAVADGQARQS